MFQKRKITRLVDGWEPGASNILIEKYRYIPPSQLKNMHQADPEGSWIADAGSLHGSGAAGIFSSVIKVDGLFRFSIDFSGFLYAFGSVKVKNR
ncbi:hypothetical protein ABFV57_04605 [Pseudomonas neuropathica]|uniref:hypothetical protein n=1 Tax=Pseudomonas neuropathica TaxID=2730425 RepID=UPI0034D68B07